MDSYLKCPVTSLKIFKEYLLAGQGSKLLVYNISNGKLVLSLKIFKSSYIHNFCENVNECGLFVVLAGKSVRCIQIEIRNGIISVNFKNEEKVFKAWLWDALWLSNDHMLLISAHNTVLNYNISTNIYHVTCSCSQQCILYSATFSSDLNTIIVAVGTVFNQVLLWKPDTRESKSHPFIDTWKRFVGHEGVIFRLRFHPNLPHLLSVSDDRSIRLWSIESETCLKMLYGHIARVWDARYLGEYIVSIGEDAVCLLWNAGGQVVKKYTGHKGKSIWSLDVKKNIIVTGGGDGAIRIRNVTKPLISVKEPFLEITIPKKQDITINEEDFPRTVKLIDHDSLILFTNEGVLWLYCLSLQRWSKILHDPNYRSYCSMDVYKKCVAIGNLGGCVKVISIDNGNVFAEKKVVSGKVHNLLWLSGKLHADFLLVCGADGILKLMLWTTDCKLSYISLLTLPYSKQRWVSSAVSLLNSDKEILSKNCEEYDDAFLICGDRRGSLHLYCLNESKDPVHSILGVHGKAGVTQVKLHSKYLYTTGRDGSYQQYKVDVIKKQLILLDKKKACKGMDWIEGIHFHNDDIIVYGFYMQSHFAAWSYQTNEMLFKIKCGGGYRSWDVLFPKQADDSLLSFMYMKGAIANIVSYNWSTSSQCTVLQNALHGREITNMKVLGKQYVKDKLLWLVATCSEDTSIIFSTYNTAKKEFRTIHTAVGHIGGVKDICFVSSSSDNSSLTGLFVSCGSRTSLKCWMLKDKVSLDEKINFETFHDHHFSCSLLAEIYNPEITLKKLKLKDHSLVDDMRYLNCSMFTLSDIYKDKLLNNVFVCVAACSDGIARIYTIHEKKIEFILALHCGKHCVQVVRHEIMCCKEDCKQVLVFTATTDGNISVWDITHVLEKYRIKCTEISDDIGSQYNQHKSSDKVAECKKEKEDSLYHHVNKNRYKFHSLNVPLFDDVKPSCRLKVHQSGVNAVDIFKTCDGFLVLSGGDDNAVCLVSLCYADYTFRIDVQISEIHAHISAVTGVKFLTDEVCASTSIDQKIKFWKIEKSRLTLIRHCNTDIADVSSMEIWKENENIQIAVTGVGLEIFQFTDGVYHDIEHS